MLNRRTFLVAGVTAAAAPDALAQAPIRASATPDALSRAIVIDARRIDRFRKLGGTSRMGRLEFRGGLVLSSSDKDFGGLSGLAIEPDGKRFLSVSDTGSWLIGSLDYAGNAPRGISKAQIGPIVAMSGRTLTRKRDQDAESVALLDGNLTNGTALIAFERNHRIGRFPIVAGALQPPTAYLKMPPDARQMSRNKGLEAMTVIAGGPHKGSVIAFSERLLDANGHHSGWLWQNGVPQRFQLTNIDDFDLTDCATLPDGTLILLERRFRWSEGVRMQMRLFKPGEIAPGRTAEGSILITADMTSEIDNMEGLAVHYDQGGATVLTLVSDDNFNTLLQRTLLLQFTLLP